MKRILITGKNSYIGSSFEKWIAQWPEEYKVDKISLRNEEWKELDFGKYDTVLHVAGIAHQDTKTDQEDLYYRVNRDMTIEIARKAKIDGVKQFIFLSSIIVYGNGNGRKKINKTTKPTPDNFYGKSKLQAEEGIGDLESEKFRIAIIRPPMVYGKGSKGNYRKLSKLAQMTPIFPNVDNERSMLYIENFCEFIKIVIDNRETGIFFPQNKEYVKTSELVKTIAETHGKKIWMIKLFKPGLKLVSRIKIINKLFGDLVYEKSMSDYTKGNYQIKSFKESIKLTEHAE